MLGQLQDAPRDAAHYSSASPAPAWSRSAEVRRQRRRSRGSLPKLQVITRAMTVQAGSRGAEAERPRLRGALTSRGRAHPGTSGLAAATFYWRERNREVDFVCAKRRITAIEVKAGRSSEARPAWTLRRIIKPQRGCSSVVTASPEQFC